MPHNRLVHSGIFVMILMVVIFPLYSIPAIAQDGTPEPEDPNLPLRVWWPDALYPEGNRDTIDGIFAEFSSIYNLDLRYYVHTVGNDVPRLQLTHDIAPDATPDLMLMRREDMVRAARDNLIVPVDGWVPASTIAGASENLLALGEVDEVLYGVPYMLDLHHMLYNTSVFDTPPDSFEAVSGAEGLLTFPGQPRTGETVSDLVLVSYLASGGEFVGPEGEPVLDEPALRTVLEFFATTVTNEVISTDLLAYAAPANYWDQIIAAETDIALVNSSLYLSQRDDVPPEFDIVTLPSPDGTPTTLADAWFWVLTTTDPQRQEEAQRFLLWVMETDRLADMSMMLDTIPSQQRALRVLDDPYIDEMSNLLPVALYVEGRNNAAAAALQQAFEAVLNGTPPDEATAAALERVSP